MSDDEHYPPENFPPDNDSSSDFEEESESEPSASSIFLEMMRHAAEQQGAVSPSSRQHVQRKIEHIEFLFGEGEKDEKDEEESPDKFDKETQGSFAVTADNVGTHQVKRISPSPLPFDDGGLSSEEQREQLIQREHEKQHRLRRQQRMRRVMGVVAGFLRALLLVGFAASLSATIFTWFTDPEFITPNVVNSLQIAAATEMAPLAAPTSLPTPNYLRRIGIVSGHRGPQNDPGAVCPDGLEEREINFNVAQLVVRNLRERGFSVDLLDEFDPRLENYQAAALVSIHSNTCQDFGEYISGYLVAKAAAKPPEGPDDALAECIAQYYEQSTRLVRRTSLTEDMTDYHTFREVHPLTPAAIIELGFMLGDRALLTEQPALLARGIVDGILCFLQPVDTPPTPIPTQTPIQIRVSTPTIPSP